ncbi:NAD(P)H-dependent oxidoreductase [Zhouia sp. PK063]|uniref:NAD(P)H-dependent oxidoreductase n=1 Tax=Zhouia sp. PK063 TaxID=3373602 RepID=UPI00379AA0CE
MKKKIFVINGGKKFAHSGGTFNKMLLEIDANYFTTSNGFELKSTDINHSYQLEEELEKFVWADVIIYHFPIWWMGMPFALKEYIDRVFTAGHRKGLYYSDGRKADNPAYNYGKGGLLQGNKYMVTTSWNAPETAFTLPNEFFQQKSVDDGILFGFHRMNEFLALEALPSFHFHDVEKNNSKARIQALYLDYQSHLKTIFPTN